MQNKNSNMNKHAYTKQLMNKSSSRNNIAMNDVSNTLNTMIGDISVQELEQVEGISPTAIARKKMSTHIAIFNKQNNKSPLSLTDKSEINYYNVHLLNAYITKRGRLLPTRITSISKKEQKLVQSSVKIARLLGLIPYVDYGKDK